MRSFLTSFLTSILGGFCAIKDEKTEYELGELVAYLLSWLQGALQGADVS